MQHNIGDRTASDNDVDIRSDQLLDELFSQVLFSLAVVQQLRGVLDQHSALGLALDGVQWARKHGNPWLGNSGDGSLNSSLDNHAAHKMRVRNTATKDLDDTDIIDVELGDVVRQTVDAGSSDQPCEEISKAWDF